MKNITKYKHKQTIITNKHKQTIKHKQTNINVQAVLPKGFLTSDLDIVNWLLLLNRFISKLQIILKQLERYEISDSSIDEEVCVEREREREREREKERERKKERESERARERESERTRNKHEQT